METILIIFGIFIYFYIIGKIVMNFLKKEKIIDATIDKKNGISFIKEITSILLVLIWNTINHISDKISIK